MADKNTPAKAGKLKVVKGPRASAKFFIWLDKTGENKVGTDPKTIDKAAGVEGYIEQGYLIDVTDQPERKESDQPAPGETENKQTGKQ